MRILLLAILVSLTLVGCRTAPPPPDTVTVTLQEGHEEFVQFVAYQDGAGDWTELTPVAGEYRFEVADGAGRYGVTVVCHYSYEGDVPYLEPLVIHATTDEFSALSLPCLEASYASPDQVPGTAITGEIINVDPAFDMLYVRGGGIGIYRTPGSGFEFSLGPVYDGVFDVLVGVVNADDVTTRLAIEHDVEVVDGSGNATIDFTTSAAVETFDLTIHGLTPGDDLVIESGLDTKNGAWALFTDTAAVAATSDHSTTFNAVPASLLATGDMQSLHITAEDAFGQTRVAGRYYPEGENLEVTLPAGDLALEATPAAPGAYPRFGVSWNDLSAGLINAYFAYDTGELETGWEVYVTPGWLAEDAYTVPDLSGLDGWDPAWNINEADITDTYNWFGAFFEPTERALRSSLDWAELQEGEYSYLSAQF